MAKLGDICTVVSGSTPSSSVAEYWDGKHFWITPAELSDDSFILYDSVRHITDKAIQETSLKPFPEGTVILSSRAPIGKTAIAGCKMYCNQGFKNLICSDSIYNKYLYFFLSAKTGQRLPKLFDMIDAVIENCALRVQTGVLNEILTEAMAMKQPPSDKGKRLRIYYITQVSVKPPTFVMFINEKKLTHFSYTRYIENQIRTTFGFRGTPIHFIYRERKEK